MNDARIALVGSPNCGKTTLFNALTGSRQKTGNYPGVTVEKKEGYVKASADGMAFTLVDLPGAYSLDARTPDEAITSQIITGAFADEQTPDAVIAVADSTSLERNLYLVLQLKELKVPMVLALTMSDLARKQGIEIARQELEQRLGIPVVFTSAVRKEGLDTLLAQVRDLLKQKGLTEKVSSREAKQVNNSSEQILGRYKEIEATLKAVVKKQDQENDLTHKIDKIVLHRIWGPLILLVFFAATFQAVFSLAQAPMDAIESVMGLAQESMRNLVPAGMLQSFLVDGVIAGVGAVVVFLPQILLLFLFILVFEDSGYMARAAFIMDRLMGRIGLQGRSFIPLLSSFACAVPGIMATRTIESHRDRLITIMVSPLMTCSARLPIYTLLISAFVPSTAIAGFLNLQGLTMLGLYLLGIVVAFTIALVLRKTAFKGENAGFVMELPTYKLPSLRNVALGLWDRASVFLKRAGTIILFISMALWVLFTFPRVDAPADLTEKQAAAYRLENSIAGKAGKAIEPLISPLGYDWRIGVGVLSSFAAREVLLSTLGQVYAIGGEDEESTNSALSQKLKSDPSFNTATAFSLLIFYALAFQCMSTLAVARRETNSWRWPLFMFTYMTALAYGGAFLVYRIALLLTAG